MNTATLAELLATTEENCPHCEGRGSHPNPEWDEWRKRRDMGINERPPFKPESIPCQVCRGKGKRLTEVGQMFVAFVQRHLW